MTSPTLGSVSLGNLQQISFTKELNIIPLPFPGEDDDVTEVFDLGGATTIYTLTGTLTSTSTSAVKTLVDNIIALADGDQTATYSLSTDQTGSVDVMIASIDIVWELPGTNSAGYSIKLIKGTAT